MAHVAEKSYGVCYDPSGAILVKMGRPRRNANAPQQLVSYERSRNLSAAAQISFRKFVSMMRAFGSSANIFRIPALKLLFVFPAILFISIISWKHGVFFARPHRRPSYGYAPGMSNAGACDGWQGAEDVVLVMKTGASEIEAKLPVHVNTTFKCAPNVMVFSDMAQKFGDLSIHDPLRHLPDNLDETDPDLRYYLGLEERRKNGEDIAKGSSAQAWALDRYKNIPMLRQVFDAHPHAKWFFFMDADTGLIWHNLLTWLSQMDPSKPLYIGSSVVGGDDIRFAHGGTGYIVSRAAAKLVAEETKEEQRKSFEITKDDCCGDSALAKVLRLHNVLITPAFPNVNGETISHLSYGKETLCFALVTMHHMNADELATLASYQDRIFDGKAIRYADFFRHLVRPQLVDRKARWDNRSPQLIGNSILESKINSYNECQLRCKKDKMCLQFSYQLGSCKISRSVLLGRPSNEPIESGWFLDRIDRFLRQEGTCAAKWSLG